MQLKLRVVCYSYNSTNNANINPTAKISKYKYSYLQKMGIYIMGSG